MAVPFTNTTDSASISTTEYFLASDSTTATYQTTACKLQVFLDLSDLIAGDEFQIKIYEKVNGGTATAVYVANVSGTQAMLWVSPILYVAEGWEVSLKRIAGTDATIAWALRKDVGDTNTFSMSNDVVTAAAIANNAIDAAAIASDAITAAKIADNAIDYATFATDAKELFGLIRKNTAQAGAATTITLDASASAVDDFYNNALIFIVSGTGALQARAITDYNGTTKVATVATWATNPDATSVFIIFANASAGSVGGTVDANVITWKGAVPADLTAAGYVQVPSRWENG